MKSQDVKMFRSKESWEARNFGGRYYLMKYLEEIELVDQVEDAWHTTYILNEKGETIIRMINDNIDEVTIDNIKYKSSL